MTQDLSSPVTDADHAIGPNDAPVTLVEYGDFECPNCKQAAPAVKLLLEHFAGRLRFVYRHFPLEEVHPHALLAAEAAETAGAQGAFWKMHDVLFANQRNLQQPHLHDYASDLALDMKRYNHEMAEHAHVQRVRGQQATGRESGVRATPGFFLNGERCDVSFGLKALEEAIERALKR
jgi:protein-disulfide isomerase